MSTVWIALGSNLGDAKAQFQEALVRLEGVLADIKLSECYRTAPVDTTGPDYVNAVVRATTTLGPEALMQTLLDVERAMGRVRPEGVRYAPRTLDLDILMSSDGAIQTRNVEIPHPRMRDRLFVLVPLSDVLPEGVLMTGENIHERIAEIEALDPPQRVEHLPNFMA